MGRAKWAATAALGFLIFATVAVAAEEAPMMKPFAVGDKIPSLSVTNLEGKAESLKFESKITAISFFNSACSACRAELSLLNSLMKQNKDLKVVAVCVDIGGADSAKRFADQTKFGFDYYMDKEFKVAERFGFSFTPGLVLVKSGGEVTYVKGGFMNKDEEEIVGKVMGK